MKYYLIILMLILSGCSEKAPDDFAKTEYKVFYEIVSDFKEVDERYIEVYSNQTDATIINFEELDTSSKFIKERYAFSYNFGDNCHIVLAQPSNYSEKELEITLGHEHRHCVNGAFH